MGLLFLIIHWLLAINTYNCEGHDVIFIHQPQDSTTVSGNDAFFPCTYTGTRGVPHWLVNLTSAYYVSALPSKHSYNGSGLIVHSVEVSMNATKYQCCFEFHLGQGVIDDICSSVGMLLIINAALPVVTSLKPCNSRNCTVPKTLQDNVTFECAVYSPFTSGPIWEIARSQYFISQLALKNPGLQISSGSNLLQSQGYFVRNTIQNHSILDITQQARQEHTHIQVRCIHFVDFETVASDYYYVFTYGAPDSPPKFALQPFSTSPSLPPVLNWQRPPNIPEDVPLTYHLQITNLTSNISDVFNITETLSYPLPDGTGCSLFKFSVTASNDVGNSTSQSIIETVPITPDVGPINSSLRVLSVDVSGGSASVTLAFDEAETCSQRYRVSDYTIVSSDGSISVNINASSDANNYTVTLNSATAPNISRGFAYNISVIACIDISDTACNSNSCQESTQFCRESKTIKVFTTDVQNPSVRYVNNSVNLTCEFAEGSTAEGCLFNFTGVTTQQSFFVNRSGDSPVASTCAIAREFANNTDYMWSAYDDIGGVPVTVGLIAVDSQDEDNFECQQDVGGGQGPSGHQGLTGGGIAGILVGAVALAVIPGVILIGCIVYYTKKKKPLEKLTYKLGSSSKYRQLGKPRVAADSDEEEGKPRVATDSDEEVQQPLITLEVKLLPGKKRIQYMIINCNDTAIEKKFSLGSKDEIITLRLTEMKQETAV